MKIAGVCGHTCNAVDNLDNKKTLYSVFTILNSYGNTKTDRMERPVYKSIFEFSRKFLWNYNGTYPIAEPNSFRVQFKFFVVCRNPSAMLIIATRLPTGEI